MLDIELANGYDYEAFTVANGVVNEDVTPTNQVMLLIQSVVVDTDVDVTVRFNAATEPGIPLTFATSPLSISTLGISSIYVTNVSGGNAIVKPL